MVKIRGDKQKSPISFGQLKEMHNEDLSEDPMGFGVIQLSTQSCPTGSESWVRPHFTWMISTTPFLVSCIIQNERNCPPSSRIGIGNKSAVVNNTSKPFEGGAL